MFNFFNKKPEQSDKSNLSINSEWVSLLEENKGRFFLFLEKLDAKAKEFTEDAVSELKILREENEREYGMMLSGIKGQLNNLREMANDTYEEKIENVYQSLKDEVDIFHPFYNQLSDFRNVCSDQLHDYFDKKIGEYDAQLDATNETDYEVLYQRILDEYEELKNQFKCQQCGDGIPLDKIYFTTTHITCPSCQNRNTFVPSTLAKGLEQIGRGLAEQRTQYLLDEYNAEQERERELYLEAHQLKLKQNFIDKNPELELKIAEIEAERQKSIKLAPQIYHKYQRAMFDEWKKLVPDLAEQTENFYQGLQNRKY